MDGGKRAEGRDAVEFLRFLPGSVSISSYEDYIKIKLNLSWIRISNIIDIRDAVLLATNPNCSIPDDWINILTANNPIERVKWKSQEFRKGL